MKEAIILMVRLPKLGNVKKRLAKTLGKERALVIYQKLIDHTRLVINEMPLHRFIYYSHETKKHEGWGNDTFFRVQRGKNQGEIYKNAFRDVFELGFQKVVLLGVDCPALERRHVQTAFLQLDKYDTCVGMSKDGGYYLIGMKKYTPSLFQNISWGQMTVIGDTFNRMMEQKLRCTFLEELIDIDTNKDLLATGFR